MIFQYPKNYCLEVFDGCKKPQLLNNIKAFLGHNEEISLVNIILIKGLYELKNNGTWIGNCEDINYYLEVVK